MELEHSKTFSQSSRSEKKWERVSNLELEWSAASFLKKWISNYVCKLVCQKLNFEAINKMKLKPQKGAWK